MQKSDLEVAGHHYEVHQFDTLSEATRLLGEQQLVGIINRGYRQRCRGFINYHTQAKRTEEEIQQLLDDYFPQDAPNKAVVALEKAISALGDSSIPPEQKRALAAKFIKAVE